MLCVCCAGPAAVSNLTVTSANTSSLSFSWRPSDGHVDIYDLSLYSVAEATANHRQDAAGSRKEHHQVGLTCFYAATLYDDRASCHHVVSVLQTVGELVDLQKVGPAADRCVFSGLRAGSLYRLQVVSWSRGMSSDSSVLSRTGQSTRSSSCYQCFNGCWSRSDLSDQRVSLFSFSIIFLDTCTPHVPSSSSCFLSFLLHSPVFSFVSSGPQFRPDGQTDGQLAARRGKLEQLSGNRRTVDVYLLLITQTKVSL